MTGILCLLQEAPGREGFKRALCGTTAWRGKALRGSRRCLCRQGQPRASSDRCTSRVLGEMSGLSIIKKWSTKVRRSCLGSAKPGQCLGCHMAAHTHLAMQKAGGRAFRWKKIKREVLMAVVGKYSENIVVFLCWEEA